MPLINQALPNLIGGVSQQPDVTRFEGQCEEQENALSSVVDGLSKRPQTKYVAELVSSAISNNSFVHFINRSDTEKYVSIHDGTTLRIFNLITGAECIIAVDGSDYSTGYAINSSTIPYLESSTPKSDLKGLTVGDSTFFVNTTKTVEEGAEVTNAQNNAGLFYIKQGAAVPYSISMSGGTIGTTPAKVNFTLTRYVWRSSIRINVHGPGDYTNYYYRWRITGATIVADDAGVTGGAGLPNGSNTINVTIHSNKSVLTPATFQTTVVGGVLTNIQVTNASTNSYEGQAIDTNTGAGTYDYIEGSYYYRAVNDTSTNSTQNPDGDYYVRVTGGAVDGTGWSTSGEVNRYNGFVKPTITCPQFDGGFQFTASAQFDNATNIVSTAGIADKLFGDSNIATVGTQELGLTRTGGTVSQRPREYFDFTLQNDQAHFNARTTKRSDASEAIDLSDASIDVTDGNANQGLGLVYLEVGSITDLPVSCKHGLKIKIRGDVETAADDYYVQFETNDAGAFGEGSWVETNGFGVKTSINNTTMPYELLNTSPDRFDLSTMSFGKRNVGDEKSNPMPSFVGKTINNLFLYKNRLGFLLQDTIVFSEAGLGVVVDASVEYNFFRTTTTTSLDSDPIDVTLSSGKVTNLHHAVGFQENLILFSRNGQFVLKSGELLTPNSVSITPITNFEYNTNVAPSAVGSYIYFPFNRGSFAGIREFTVNSTTDNYDAEEITEHVPVYLPSDLETMVGSTSEDIIVGFAPSVPKTLYIYKYFWSGQKKLLSAWSTFTLPLDIRGFDVFEGTMYIVGTKESKTHLLSMPLQSGLKDTGMNYNTYLDMRKEHTLDNTTAVQLGFTASAGDRVQVWDDEGQSLHDQTLTSTATLVTLGTAHTGKVFSGLAYTMKYVFSEQVFKQQAGNSKAPSGFTRAQIRNGALFFNDTRGFKVKVKPDNRDETTHTFTPTLIGTSSAGNIELNSGNFRFPVFTDARGTTITVENDSALPANFSSAEFETFVHERSKRFG